MMSIPRCWPRWLAGLAACATGLVLAAPTYHVVDLGSLGARPDSWPMAINRRGQVVGMVEQGRNAVSRPVRFEHGQAIDLIVESGVDALAGRANAINGRGDIAGGLYLDGIGTRPFVLRDGSMELMSMPTGQSGYAAGLSDRGHLLAIGEDVGCILCSFVRQPDGTWIALARWHNGDIAVGEAINRRGWVAGWADGERRDGPRRAIVWRQGEARLVPGTEASPSAWAMAINDEGDVAGYFSVNGRWHAYTVRGGALTDLETDPSADSLAYGLDESGRVVGRRMAGGRSGAFLADSGQLLWLEDLVEPDQQGRWTLYYAVDINEAGEIAAVGRSKSGKVHALRLVPAPAR